MPKWLSLLPYALLGFSTWFAGAGHQWAIGLLLLTVAWLLGLAATDLANWIKAKPKPEKPE